MTREDAIQLLTSNSAHVRLRAARCLTQQAEAGDISILKSARLRETVAYVQASLDSTISRLSILPDPHILDRTDQLDVADAIKKRIHRQAVEQVTGLLLHEIAPPLGRAKRTAFREIIEYEHSRTKHHLDNIERIFEAIEQLKGATKVSRPEKFNLSDLITEIVNTEAGEGRVSQVSLVGPGPMMVMSDRTLVHFALCNGVRNALEATAGASVVDPHLIVINWGYTDIDYWVSILDRGTGIIGPIEAAFEIGKSTKKDHSGFGLAIARQAIENLGGMVTLSPAAQGGTRYEARWERCEHKC